MKISLAKNVAEAVKADILAVPVRQGKPERDAQVRKLDRLLGGALSAHIKQEKFTGKPRSRLRFPGQGKLAAKQVLLVGTGEDKPTVKSMRTLGATVAFSVRSRASLALLVPSAKDEHVAALADGIVGGAYRYTRYLTGDRVPKTTLGKVQLVVDKPPTASQRTAVRSGIALGESVNEARDLVNCPPNDLTATALADFAASSARGAGVRCRVYDKRGIEKLNMPLLLAVNRGSKEEPRFIHMTYKPKGLRKPPKVVFVGKGLTFDSGGLCLKPGGSMLDMKCDMAGSAVTIGVVLAAARLKLPIEVHGVIGSTDNMTGPDAYRPGDVFPSREGKTVEIINTDAEGRLVLADALDYAVGLKPDYLVDHATLTGACMVALGSHRAALFSNDDKMRVAYEKASERAGEAFWPLPLDDDLRGQLKSSIADLKHTGARFGGTITAALFLREFVGKCTWAHLDIAGPAFLDSRHGNNPKGGTGFGILTAIEFLKSL